MFVSWVVSTGKRGLNEPEADNAIDKDDDRDSPRREH